MRRLLQRLDQFQLTVRIYAWLFFATIWGFVKQLFFYRR